MTFRPASRCGGGTCVEVDLGEDADMGFAKSGRCGSSACVEVDAKGEMVKVRDSKEDGGPVLSFTQDEWRAFLAGAKAGEFDIADDDDSAALAAETMGRED